MRTSILGAIAIVSVIADASQRGGGITPANEMASAVVMAAPMLAVVEPFVTSAPSVTSAMNEGTMTAKVWAVQFGGWPEFVYKDRVAEDWYRNRWIDANLDGDARDFPNDHRDPICYTVEALIAIQGVGIAVTPENAFDPADARIVGRVQGQDRFTVNTVQASSIPGVGWVVSGSPVIGTIAPPPTIALWENWTIDWRDDQAESTGKPAEIVRRFDDADVSLIRFL